MEMIFLKLLNMSITAGWLVLAILLLRLLLKKAPKSITVALWALVAIRLIYPFSIESVLSLVPSAETIPENIIYEKEPAIHTGISTINKVVNPIITDSFAPTGFGSVNPLQIVLFVAANLWLIGMIAMVLYTAISYLRIHRKVCEAAPLTENIWLCDRISSPFILGIIRPKIYLPSDIREQDMEYVVAHEKAHIRRKDHLWKPFGFLLLTIYWFHPLLWVAYILLCRDIEFACDEKVIRELGNDSKKPYSDALVNCSVSRKTITACPLAFGEVGVRKRIRSVLNYKKPAFWVILVAVVVSIVAAICFLTNPPNHSEKIPSQDETEETVPETTPEETEPPETSLNTSEEVPPETTEANPLEGLSGPAKKVSLTYMGAASATFHHWFHFEFLMDYTHVEASCTNGELEIMEVPYFDEVRGTNIRAEAGKKIGWDPYVPGDNTFTLVPGTDITLTFYQGEQITQTCIIHITQTFVDFLHATYEASISSEQELYFFFAGSNLGGVIAEPSSLIIEEPTITSTKTISQLKEKFPEYFDLETRDGLEVCVWQMSENSLYWGLIPGGMESYPMEKLWNLAPASLNEIRTIVESYALNDSEIKIHPIYMPYSSYYYTIDSTMKQELEKLFWAADVLA